MIPSDTDDYFNQVTKVNIFEAAYLGEFLFTDTGIRGSANIINISHNSLYLFIPKDVFTGLPERAKVEILLNILRRPLLSNINDEHEGDEYQIFPKRNYSPKGFEGIHLSKEDDPSHYKLHFKEKYSNGMGIEPAGFGYLGLVISGKVEVYKNEDNFKKLAEIHAGHTIFESNVAGLENHNVDIFSGSNETEILWVYVANDDPKYLELLKSAVHGIYTKLEAINKLRAASLSVKNLTI